MLAMLFVLGIPLMGIYLFSVSLETADITLMCIGILLILLFPPIITINVLKVKTAIKGR
jgi:hypothetical protein